MADVNLRNVPILGFYIVATKKGALGDFAVAVLVF